MTSADVATLLELLAGAAAVLSFGLGFLAGLQ